MVLVFAAALALAMPLCAEGPRAWAVVLAVAFASRWVAAPIRLHRGARYPAEPDDRPFDPDAPEAPRRLAGRIRRTAADLEGGLPGQLAAALAGARSPRGGPATAGGAGLAGAGAVRRRRHGFRPATTEVAVE